MAKVYVSIGSNIEREKHIVAGLDALADRFGELLVSSVYESEAVGFVGDHFLNLVAGFDTTLPVGALSVLLRDIEHRSGRTRSETRFSGRTLDIDILTYDDCCGVVDGIALPRAEILDNAFVLLPLAEIAPAVLHPAEKKSYAVLWKAYRHPQKLWPVDFIWRNRVISRAAHT
ncbi:MAG TPA: 2-amino-4-hydroxy-6-hydroxymethyldihydropteridine diphosphokinase [Pseudomonadales bacterium]|nr:2-amino-4-hydroxy-6-hydroxymethyldihydropteridine diphosphokinase [Pseudomonadales bacterium]